MSPLQLLLLTLFLTLATAFPTNKTPTTTDPPVTLPTTVPATSNFTFTACAIEPFENSVEARALHAQTYLNSSLTVQSCATLCAKYSYFGVEYGDQCYCANAVNVATTADISGGCDVPCAGDRTQLCGGAGRLNLYQNIAVQSTLDLPPDLNDTNTDIPPKVLNNWDYVACALEPFQNGVDGPRALNGSSFSSGRMTVERCASRCAGYNFFGVEYSRQCFCGDTLQPGTALDTCQECTMRCTGNNTQTCGGAGRLNLFRAKNQTPGAVVIVLPAPAPGRSSCAGSKTSTGTFPGSTGRSAMSTTSSSSHGKSSTTASANTTPCTRTSTSAHMSSSTHINNPTHTSTTITDPPTATTTKVT